MQWRQVGRIWRHIFECAVWEILAFDFEGAAFEGELRPLFLRFCILLFHPFFQIVDGGLKRGKPFGLGAGGDHHACAVASDETKAWKATVSKAPVRPAIAAHGGVVSVRNVEDVCTAFVERFLFLFVHTWDMKQ